MRDSIMHGGCDGSFYECRSLFFKRIKIFSCSCLIQIKIFTYLFQNSIIA